MLQIRLLSQSTRGCMSLCLLFWMFFHQKAEAFLVTLTNTVPSQTNPPRIAGCSSSISLQTQTAALFATQPSHHDEKKQDDEPPLSEAELLVNDPNDNDDEDAMEWIPDRVQAQVKRLEQRRMLEKIAETNPPGDDDNTDNNTNQIGAASEASSSSSWPSPYTEEEEEVIASMGGRSSGQQSYREVGYLGDSTLAEIATDYSVPICYLADVLCMWGVVPPIPIHGVPLGDLVTGEQAFALLEAVNSLDMGALNDRYSNTDLRQLCFEYNIDLQDAFSMAVKEGWSLPFGVDTCLRVEQEDELLRVLRHEGSRMTSSVLEHEDDDEEDYEYGSNGYY